MSYDENYPVADLKLGKLFQGAEIYSDSGEDFQITDEIAKVELTLIAGDCTIIIPKAVQYGYSII
jgi:hypothetical protein